MTCTASRDEQKLLFWADWWITHCVILHITSLQKSHRCGQEHWRKQTSSAQSRTSGKTNPSETHTKLIGFRIREESAAEKMLHSSKEHPPSGFVFSKMTLIIRIRMTCLMECVRYKWLTAANTRSQPIVLSKACSCVCAHTHTHAGGLPQQCPPSHCRVCLPRFALLLKLGLCMALHPGHLLLYRSSWRACLDIKKRYVHRFPNFPTLRCVVCSHFLWDSSTFIFVNRLLLPTPRGSGVCIVSRSARIMRGKFALINNVGFKRGFTLQVI